VLQVIFLGIATQPRAQQASPVDRYSELTAAGIAAGQKGDYGTSVERFREALDVARDAGDQERIATATYNTATSTYFLNRHDAAMPLFEQFLQMPESRESKFSSSRLAAYVFLCNSHAELNHGDEAFRICDSAVANTADSPKKAVFLEVLGNWI